MTDEQLINALLKENLLDDIRVNQIKREALISGQNVEQIIFDKKLVSDLDIANLKSKIFDIPVIKIDLNKIDENLLSIIPEETARTYGIAPVGLDGNNLFVGMISPDDEKAIEVLKFIARRNKLNLGVYIISYGDWLNVLSKYSPYKNEIAYALKSLGLKQGETSSRKSISLEENLSTGKEEAPIIKIVSETLKEAVDRRASDIHIEPQEKRLRIRFRIDGELREAASLPVELSQPIISRIKVISNLKIDETRIPQDGRFRAKIFDKDIDFRVSTFPTPLGEKAAIRVLDPTVGIKNFNELGLSGLNLEKVQRGLKKPYGMVLITGPTGSGKTTTLYAFLQELNKESVNIVSLEDPVEYFISGLNQSQVHPEIGYDFASGLRQILRQDPDIIMVGEMRDTETASLAVQAALTGHIVLSTLHTNNSLGVIPRLIDMGVEPFLLPSSLNLMIAQRLFGKLCQNCKQEKVATDKVQDIIEKNLEILPDEIKSKYSKPYKIYYSQGCNICRGKGILGRVAIFEVFEMTATLEEIIISNPTNQKLLEEAKKQKMITMRQDGILKALDGIVSIEEILGGTEDYF
ncbi:MAG: GspE/PulE family protein [Patescibacteria group bacterium]|nr:GspE/PulE family protein [Patescibacteria group bacterium]MCX7589377.1 GspE/PulE family protein [Patescibacteria group bacterium]MDW8279880.1 GspE/PulE family protein [bacterium]